MTVLPPNADELVSAYLDGEAAPDEIAIVEASDELMARVEALREVSARLSEPIAVPGALRESHLAAALAEFDTLQQAKPALEQPAPATRDGVISIAEARQRRRPPRLNVIAAAAAVVAVLFIGITAITLRDGSNADDELATTAMSAEESLESAGDALDSSDATDAADAAAVDTTAEGAAEAPEAPEADLDVAAEPPAEALQAPAAAPGIGAADEAADAAMDEEEAMEEEASEPSAEAEAADDAEVAIEEDAAGDIASRDLADLARSSVFYLGRFDSEPALGQELANRVIPLEQGLFPDEVELPNCQNQIAELEQLDRVTLVATADLLDRVVEAHAIDDNTVLLVDQATCMIIGELGP